MIFVKCHLSSHFKKVISSYFTNGVLVELDSFIYSVSIFSRKCSSKCVFSAEEKKHFIDRLKKIRVQQYRTTSKLSNAAVLIPLCNVNDEISILYTLRRQDLRKHKGQVSFPGGKEDSEDGNLETTALRETEEELGIKKSSIDVWGIGNIVVGKEFNILPVVGYVGDINIDCLKPNPSEVEFAFTIPLKHFYDPRNCRYTQYRDGSGYVLPVYTNAKCKIWGITALMTHIVLSALSPKKYTHKLQLIKPVKS